MKKMNGKLKYLNSEVLLLFLIFLINSCTTEDSKDFYKKSIDKIKSKEYDKAFEYINKSLVRRRLCLSRIYETGFA